MATRPSTDRVQIAAGPGTCRIIWAGVVGYREAWDWQVRIADGVRDGSQPETLLLLEHPHTYTRGRLAPDGDLLLDEPTLAARGITVVETDRGGLITYHGPGQLVAYPIIRLRSGLLTKQRGGPHWYVHTLEQVIINVLAEFGLPTATVDGRTGVWTADGQRKIAAIGVKIAGGVAYHGFAINVDPDLAMFDGIVPCGITDREVTSMAAELGRAVDLDAVAGIAARQFCAELGLAANFAV
ncbi:MAG: lipoyl(octanoyl) transferase LipB [Chloroflexota bacterium]|nr:lipoyl(octanoyl) transferase LipB [Chloroflexota bacterium]MDE2959528.1 lipoyl(octanoyl) transferase LipB [Chloroflexota bacterium]